MPIPPIVACQLATQLAPLFDRLKPFPPPTSDGGLPAGELISENELMPNDAGSLI